VPAESAVLSLDPHSDPTVSTPTQWTLCEAVSFASASNDGGGAATWLPFALLSVVYVLEFVDEDAALPVLEKAQPAAPLPWLR